VGDGGNDFCPMLKLKDSDLAFTREGYAIDRVIERRKTKDGLEIKAQRVKWTCGNDILNQVQQKLLQG